MVCFYFFGHDACGILTPWPGIEPIPLVLESEVLTTGLPGKSLTLTNILSFFFFLMEEGAHDNQSAKGP